MPPPDGQHPEGTESWSLVPERLSSERRPYLLVVAGSQLGEIFPLEADREIVMGRDPSCEIRLRDTGVSRRHAGIMASPEGARLRDLGSTNGVFVEGVRVTDCQMKDGQRIQVGMGTAFKYCLCDDLEIGFQRRLAEGALLDPETGLYNRRHFDDRLAAELVTSQRYTRPMSLLLVDVDHFRRVNELHGRAAGDEALSLVARLVRSAVRREDVLARIDGEEFGVVARETPLSAGRALGERIRKAVEAGRITARGQDLFLTVSVGVVGIDGLASYTPSRTEREAMALAEGALRRARDAGGNRVEGEGPLSLP